MTPPHLKRVRDLLESYHMYAELATKGITKGHLLKVLDVAEALCCGYHPHLHSITLNPLASRAHRRRRKIRPGKKYAEILILVVFDEAAMSLRQIIPELKAPDPSGSGKSRI